MNITTQATPDGAIAVLRGELDIATAPYARAILLGCEMWEGAALGPGSPARELILDLAGLDFLDSSGLSVLIEVRKAMDGHGGTLVLRDPRAAVRRVLEVTGLFDFFGLNQHEPV